LFAVKGYLTPKIHRRTASVNPFFSASFIEAVMFCMKCSKSKKKKITETAAHA